MYKYTHARSYYLRIYFVCISKSYKIYRSLLSNEYLCDVGSAQVTWTSPSKEGRCYLMVSFDFLSISVHPVSILFYVARIVLRSHENIPVIV